VWQPHLSLGGQHVGEFEQGRQGQRARIDRHQQWRLRALPDQGTGCASKLQCDALPVAASTQGPMSS